MKSKLWMFALVASLLVSAQSAFAGGVSFQFRGLVTPVSEEVGLVYISPAERGTVRVVHDAHPCVPFRPCAAVAPASTVVIPKLIADQSSSGGEMVFELTSDIHLTAKPLSPADKGHQFSVTVKTGFRSGPTEVTLPLSPIVDLKELVDEAREESH